MVVNVAINGFGRIGRLAFRELVERGDTDLKIVWVNEVKGGVECAAHLIEFDSVHGRWQRFEAGVEDGKMTVTEKANGKKQLIKFSEFSNPTAIPWSELSVDIVLECSGKFVASTDDCNGHFVDAEGKKKGVKKVVVSAPVKAAGKVRGDKALEIVYGVNDDLYRKDPSKHEIVTAASCTTNCLAPIVKVLVETVGVKAGLMTTIHDVTNTQVICDAPHKDLRRARSCLTSLVPTSTGSAKAVIKIFPQLEGKLTGVAIRVPLLTGSLVDLVFVPEKKTSVEELNAILKRYTEDQLKGILGYESKPLVSVDYCHDRRSGIVDAQSTMCVSDGEIQQFKILAFYDNEYGYSVRMVDVTAMVASLL